MEGGRELGERAVVSGVAAETVGSWPYKIFPLNAEEAGACAIVLRY